MPVSQGGMLLHQALRGLGQDLHQRRQLEAQREAQRIAAAQSVQAQVPGTWETMLGRQTAMDRMAYDHAQKAQGDVLSAAKARLDAQIRQAKAAQDAARDKARDARDAKMEEGRAAREAAREKRLAGEGKARGEVDRRRAGAAERMARAAETRAKRPSGGGRDYAMAEAIAELGVAQRDRNAARTAMTQLAKTPEWEKDPAQTTVVWKRELSNANAAQKRIDELQEFINRLRGAGPAAVDDPVDVAPPGFDVLDARMGVR